MCQVRNVPINTPYRNRHFGGYADSCLVEVIKEFNDIGAMTVASCCGHGVDTPYLTAIHERDMISDLKKLLKKRLGWGRTDVFIWSMYEDARKQLGSFVDDKVYVGYYAVGNVGFAAVGGEEYIVDEE